MGIFSSKGRSKTSSEQPERVPNAPPATTRHRWTIESISAEWPREPVDNLEILVGDAIREYESGEDYYAMRRAMGLLAPIVASSLQQTSQLDGEIVQQLTYNLVFAAQTAPTDERQALSLTDEGATVPAAWLGNDEAKQLAAGEIWRGRLV